MAGTLGLDIGGANIKAAHSNGACRSVAFALWRQPGDLAQELAAVVQAMPAADRIGVTMTAELCDCFAYKSTGVNAVLDAVERVAGSTPVRVWQTGGRFVDARAAREQTLQTAAANWHAQATYIGQLEPDVNAVLIDTGSTTTDIIPIMRGRVVAQGLTDLERLGTRELVYIGAKRTSLMALGPNVWFDNQSWSTMAEHFATMDDVLMVLGMTQSAADENDTADGAPRTQTFAQMRLARTIGADMSMLSEDQVQSLAEGFIDIAIQLIGNGVIRSLVPLDGKVDHFIISGSGAHLAELGAQRARPDVKTRRLAELIGEQGATAACAYAVAKLLDSE